MHGILWTLFWPWCICIIVYMQRIRGSEPCCYLKIISVIIVVNEPL